MIITTTLCGPSHVDNLSRALASVSWAARRVVIDTSPGEASEAIARAAFDHDALVWRWPWQGGFGAARNEALRAATEIAPAMQFESRDSCAWALTVDADEWIVCPDPDALYDVVANTRADVIEIPCAGAGYVQPRLIRLPTMARWVGPAHEYLDGPELRLVRTDLLAFDADPKTSEELEQKWERDLAALLPHTTRDPSARWHYYIGRAYWGQHRYELALQHYDRCALMPGWDEQAAFARFEGALILTEHLGQHEEAIRWCGLGLALHPGMAELAWLAAVASVRRGRHDHARCWAELAVVHRLGSRAERARRGFRFKRGLMGVPDEVLACMT